MFSSISKSTRVLAGTARVAALAALAVAAANPAFAQARTLTGTWLVVTQQVNCATDVAVGPPHRALVTFHKGGTLSDTSVVPSFQLGQRTEGHGIWAHDGGQTYIARWTAMITFNSPAGSPPPSFQAGWQVATNTITLEDRDAFTSRGTSEFFNLADEKYFVGCASRTGTRFR
jgi:hypothetical protein